MPAARALNVALVDRVSPAPDWFGPSAKNEVTYTIFDHLIQIGRVAPGMFIPSPGWSYRAAQLQTWDVVLYFVLDRSQSLVRKKLGVEPPGGTGGGYTFFDGTVTLSEIYVDGSMPARRLGNVAFHELMHNKLKMGKEMHLLRGVAASPTPEGGRLFRGAIQQLSAALFRAVPQYTNGM
jgi:hypothetical protein